MIQGSWPAFPCSRLGGLSAAERVLAESEARSTLLARRPSDMSVAGATLRQVQQTTADAISAMAAAETELQHSTAAQHTAQAAADVPEGTEAVGSAVHGGDAEAPDAPVATAASGSLGSDGGDVPTAVDGVGGGGSVSESAEGSILVGVAGGDGQESISSAETLESIDVEAEHGAAGQGFDSEDGTDIESPAGWAPESSTKDKRGE